MSASDPIADIVTRRDDLDRAMSVFAVLGENVHG